MNREAREEIAFGVLFAARRQIATLDGDRVHIKGSSNKDLR